MLQFWVLHLPRVVTVATVVTVERLELLVWQDNPELLVPMAQRAQMARTARMSASVKF
jgi:hypothetical protein